MSDFLSNFNSDTYKKTRTEKELKKETKESHPSEEEKEHQTEEQSKSAEYHPQPSKAPTRSEVVRPAPVTPKPVAQQDPEPVATRRSSSGGENEEQTEVDPTYKKRKRKKIILFSSLAVIAALLLFWLYYSLSHVKVPEFEGKPISEVRTWAGENKVELAIKQEFSLKDDVNTVIKQAISPGKKVKKGGKLPLTVSQGADPDQLIPWPDFSKLAQPEAEAWVKENKAENLSILTEYSDTIKKGQYIRQEISNKEITPESYRRKDSGIVYYSKGQEVYEKNISMPDFTGKAKTEVATWVKTNEIAVTYEEVDSDTVAAGMVVSQSIAKDTKIAKREAITFQISLGKAITVPNFAELTPTTAATVDGLVVNVKQVFSNTISYGQLIAQTIEAGTKLTEKDNKNVTVTYSAGRPYLRSYIGKLEGDLPEAFYNDYQSKGANIRYTVYYVDSAAEKGSVVKMSAYNEYVPIDYVVSIGVSLGNLTPQEPAAPPTDKPEAEEGANANHEADTAQ